MTRDSTPLGQWHAGLPTSTRAPSLFGFAVLGLAVLGFAVWSASAPIDGAVLAPGTFVATGQNKTIQHLEGGIIRDILVREGDIVSPGQTLIKLDSTAARSKLRRLELRHYLLMATEDRLNSEARGLTEVRLSKDVLEAARDPDVMKIVNNQRIIFSARMNKLKSEISILEQRIDGFRERVAGAKQQLASTKEQIKFLDEELEGKLTLHEKGLVKHTDILALKGKRARLEGEVGRLRGLLGDANERITTVQEQIARTKFEAIKEAVEELHTSEKETQDVREQIKAARDVLHRIDIVAPVKGAVVKLKYHTPGGVIEPGKDIMTLLPVMEELIIQARVRPQDIDNVKTGQNAIVRLTALSQRVTPMIPGKVIYVSADTLPGEQLTQAASDAYVARIRLDAEEASKLNGFHPTPGMPVEIFIKTGKRTFIQYLMQPVIDSMTRAFRES